MACDASRTCPVCAWRGACTRRFAAGRDASLHCPEFTEDLLLRRQAEGESSTSSRKDQD